MLFGLDTGGSVGGLLVFVAWRCAGGLPVTALKGSKGSMGGSSGRAFEKRDRPVLGGARDDGFSMMGADP